MSTGTPRPYQRSQRPNKPSAGAYPQTTLLRSLFDRRLMNLADRGGASGYVGTEWGVQCSRWMEGHVGAPIMWGGGNVGTIEQYIDVDGLAGMAPFASARALQNPDYLLVISMDEGIALVGADAKFSVETAKPRQVSSEVIAALVETEGSPLRPLIPAYDLIVDGFFLSPDFELTDLVLGGRGGIQRVSIDTSDVVRVSADVPVMFQRSDIHAAMAELADIDRAGKAWEHDLAAALYYARLAFACLGCHLDERKPLLGRWNPADERDIGLASAISDRSSQGRSAWALVISWDRDAERIRETRLQIHSATDIGLMNRDLRTMIESDARKLGTAPPSLNRVRRALSVWAMGEIDTRLGTVMWPIDDLDGLIRQIRSVVDSLRPQIREQVRSIVSADAATPQ